MIGPRVDHTQLPPEQWQAILQQALADHRANPDDQEAMDAIRDANTALNAYEQPAIQAGENVGESGFGKVGPAVKGLGESALDVPKGLFNLVAHPIQSLESIPKIPGAVSAGLTSGDPEQIARTVGNVGSLALPFTKTSRAAEASSVGGLATKALTAPFRAGKALLERPAARNALLGEQQALAAARRAAAELRNQQIIPKQIEQAGLRTDLLKQQVSRAPAQTEAALRRVQMLEQQLERGPATAENLGLRNQLLQLRLELMQGGEEGGIVQPAVPADVTATPPNMQPSTLIPGRTGFEFTGEAPPPKPVTPAMEALSRLQGTTSLEDIINRNAQPRPLDTGTLSNQLIGTGPESITPEALSKVQIIGEESPMAKLGKAVKSPQKRVTFGKESPYSKSLKQDVLNLLGEIAKEQ